MPRQDKAQKSILVSRIFRLLKTAVIPKGLLSDIAREEARSREMDANSVKIQSENKRIYKLV